MPKVPVTKIHKWAYAPTAALPFGKLPIQKQVQRPLSKLTRRTANGSEWKA
jgi:hypothetical protein